MGCHEDSLRRQLIVFRLLAELPQQAEIAIFFCDFAEGESDVIDFSKDDPFHLDLIVLEAK